MRCAVCGDRKGPFYRANAKGEKAIWACERHVLKKPDRELRRLVDTLPAPAAVPAKDTPPDKE